MIKRFNEVRSLTCAGGWGWASQTQWQEQVKKAVCVCVSPSLNRSKWVSRTCLDKFNNLIMESSAAWHKMKCSEIWTFSWAHCSKFNHLDANLHKILLRTHIHSQHANIRCTCDNVSERCECTLCDLTCAGLRASSARVVLVSPLSSLTPYLAPPSVEQQPMGKRDEEGRKVRGRGGV